MPRIPRGQLAGYVYHILNRGNGGMRIFHKKGDFSSFVHLLGEAKAKFSVKVFAFCLMPNHFHLVVEPGTQGELSPFMQWWMTSHVRRYHHHYGTYGHVWQGRFKSFPIQQDSHLLTVLRYVLCNPIRAGLVDRVARWPWTSLHYPRITDAWPVLPPTDWESWLQEPLPDRELRRLRESVKRQAPYGDQDWQERIATALGLRTTLRPRGRPRRIPEK